MDKNSKYQQSTSKGVPADAKKNQDVTNNKLFPKTSSRRFEPSSAGASFSKNEQPKKTNVQRTKSFDKRPKRKGQYHGGSKEDTKVVETEEPVHNSVLAQGRKKQNLNHLLNFHYESRDVHGGLSTWNEKSMKVYNRNSNRWLPPIQRHKYNKEQFLQASCQFVVTANGNYSMYLTDPDILVDWKLVEQIKLHSSESLSCPICLCPPVAGKMTRCGHVYCWPCILHYLSLSDKSWRKCPICYESVCKADLKSVVEIPQSALNLGDTVSLRLMRREKGSLLAVPVGSLTHNPTNFFSASEDISHQAYSKLLIASAQDVMDIIELERVQLNVELIDDPNAPANCYIEQALLELLKREDEVFLNDMPKSKGATSVETSSEAKTLKDVSNEKEESLTADTGDDRESRNVSCKDDTLEIEEESAKMTENVSSNIQSSSGVSKFFYFYQADDGQHVYLHAVNVKMLEKQYGNLENSPHVITGRLLEKEGVGLTEDLRRRLRYLCHLPITCQFEVAEIELKPPIISREVLCSFRDQLALRQKHRQRREREESKREKKINEAENIRMGKYPTPNVHIDSHRHFPQWHPEALFAEEGASSPPESANISYIASSPSLSTYDEMVSSGQTEKNQESGPSFAEMLRNKGARAKSANVWPSVGSAYSKSLSTVSARSSSRDIEEDDYTTVPSNSYSFGDTLARDLQQAQLLSKGRKNGGSAKCKK